MKIPRLLHETDLARTALLPRDLKRSKLKAIRDFVPRHSWAPFRETLPGIFQAKKSLLGLPPVSLADVKAAITRLCKKHPNWAESNIALAELLFDYVKKSKFQSVENSFGLLPVGFGTSVKFWPDFYTIDQDRLLVHFVDPRRGNGLTAQARQFVFSTMHYHIAARADFAEAKFAAISFPFDESGLKRQVRVHEMSLDDLVEIEHLEAAIQETYEIWLEILAEREKEARGRPPKEGTML
jgi:hypothetical protein